MVLLSLFTYLNQHKKCFYGIFLILIILLTENLVHPKKLHSFEKNIS